MQAYQRCGRGCGITHHQRQMLDAFALRLVGDRMKRADIRGQGRVSTAGDGDPGQAACGQRAGRCRRGLLTPGAKRGDRDDGDVVTGGEGFQLRAAHHVTPVGCDDLAQQRCPAQPGHLAQVHSGFGVPGTLKDSAGLGQ